MYITEKVQYRGLALFFNPAIWQVVEGIGTIMFIKFHKRMSIVA